MMKASQRHAGIFFSPETYIETRLFIPIVTTGSDLDNNRKTRHGSTVKSLNIPRIDRLHL